MASRAQVYPDYSYRGEVPRQHRPLRFQTNDPVVLPRSRSWDISGGLIAAAAAATLLVAGATYAVYYTEPPRLSETPASPLEREYVPDADFARVNALTALSSPASLSAPGAAPAAAPASGIGDVSQPPPASPSITPSSSSGTSSAASSGQSEVLIDDSAPGLQESLPQPTENQPSVAPYPDPTMTPPDAIAPSSEGTTTEQGSSSLESENPYR